MQIKNKNIIDLLHSILTYINLNYCNKFIIENNVQNATSLAN